MFKQGTSLLLPALSEETNYVPADWQPKPTAATARARAAAAKNAAALAAKAAIEASTAARYALRKVRQPIYNTGQTVQVAPRTMPGFNFLGGEGTITEIHHIKNKHPKPKTKRPEGSATSQYLYHIRFVIRNTTEKWVDISWITPADMETQPPPREGRGVDINDDVRRRNPPDRAAKNKN